MGSMAQGNVVAVKDAPTISYREESARNTGQRELLKYAVRKDVTTKLSREECV